MIKKDYASLSAVGGSKAVPFVQKLFCKMVQPQKNFKHMKTIKEIIQSKEIEIIEDTQLEQLKGGITMTDNVVL